MGTISDKLTYLAQTKEAIKDKLTEYGIDVSTGDSFRSYVDKIDEMRASYVCEPLPYTTKKVNGYDPTRVSPYLKIYASDFNSYSVEEWGELVKNNPNLKDTLQPIGLDFKSMGEHFVLLFYTEVIPDYISVPGTNTTGVVEGASSARLNNQSWKPNPSDSSCYYGLRHSMYNYQMVNSTSYSYKKNPDNSNATITQDKDNFILGSPNTPFTWTIKANCTTRYNTYEPQKDILRAEAIYAQTEWLRHRASIIAKDGNNNDITTNLPDKTMADRVDIVTENGEMYFKIIVDENDSSKDILTNNLAKYNIHSFCTGSNPTQAIIDQIYNDQKANGVNMNSGLDPNDPVKILTPGSKGAEAYVFQGKWRIITPILTQCNISYSTDRNMTDSPVIYYWMNVLRPKYEAMGINNIQLLNEKWILSYAINRLTFTPLIESLYNFLHNAKGGGYGYDVVPNFFSQSSWCMARIWNVSAISSTMSNPTLSSSATYARYAPLIGFDLEPVAPPIITYDNDNNLITITAESGIDIYYSIKSGAVANTEPTLVEIRKGNSNIIKYTAPFHPTSSWLSFTVRAIAVRNNYKCSVPTCEYIEAD